MANLLNLRKETTSVVVEKIVTKPRSVWFESIKVLTIIAIVSVGVVYGVSRATTPGPTPDTNYTGIYGTVTAIDGATLVLDDSKGSQYKGINTFNADVTNLKTVETNEDVPTRITLADIKVGDTIIARGIIDGVTIDTYDIVSFSYASPVVTPKVVPVPTTATTTPEVVASSRESVASSTDQVNTTTDISTSTDSEIPQSSGTTTEQSPVIIPGPVTSSIQEVVVPTPEVPVIDAASSTH